MSETPPKRVSVKNCKTEFSALVWRLGITPNALLSYEVLLLRHLAKLLSQLEQTLLVNEWLSCSCFQGPKMVIVTCIKIHKFQK